MERQACRRNAAAPLGACLLLLLAVAVGQAACGAPPVAGPPPGGTKAVAVVDLDGSVNPGSGDYLVRAIEAANAAGAEALVVRLDTPGGMVETTRAIVKAELASGVPIVVWVGPSGARAGSAGVFLTVAAHVAAMAPATNIGAAHPVQMGPGQAPAEKDKTLDDKVVNDLAAWAEGIARERGRNAEWVAKAVRESVSVPAEKALELKVVDLIAPDLQALLRAIDGRAVQTRAGEVKLSTLDKPLWRLTMTPRERLLNGLGDPNIAFLLIGLGVLAILAELYHPGTLVPGVVGVVSLAVGLLATRMLPVRVGSIVLVLVGAGLIAAEFFVTSYGLLAVAGTACLVLGGFLLVDPTDSDYLIDRGFGVDWPTVLPLLLLVGGALALVVWKVTEARLRKPVTGVEGMVGELGVAAEPVGPSAGKAYLHGELWEARSAVPIARDGQVRVVRVEGLLAYVEPAPEAPELGPGTSGPGAA